MDLEKIFSDRLHPTAKKQDKQNKQKQMWQAMARLLKVPRHFHSRLKQNLLAPLR